MPIVVKPMTALQVKKLTRVGMHAVGGVQGLCFRIIETGARGWILRIHIEGKRRCIGLGGYPDVCLQEARETAHDYRVMVRRGQNPIEMRRAEREAWRRQHLQRMTFAQVASKYMAMKEKEFSNPKHAQQWHRTIEQYAYPVLARMPVNEIALEHIIQVLEPIWATTTETAKRLRGRIEKVLDFAKVSGYREGDNPAIWNGNLEAVLPKPSRIMNRKHHKALPVDDLPGFFQDLQDRQGDSARALELVVLTALRSGEVRGAQWSEIDLENGLWTIPAERMKARKDHTLPLSAPALALLHAQPRHEGSDLVFHAPRGSQLSDMALGSVMRRMEVDAVPHGFRSTFSDWAAERTHHAREVVEMALAHTIGNKVEAAYRRGDLLEKRKLLMQDWAGYCLSAYSQGGIVSIHSRAKSWR